jgi:hypothetical protein
MDRAGWIAVVPGWIAVFHVKRWNASRLTSAAEIAQATGDPVFHVKRRHDTPVPLATTTPRTYKAST